jgi:hypothetical protein
VDSYALLHLDHSTLHAALLTVCDGEEIMIAIAASAVVPSWHSSLVISVLGSGTGPVSRFDYRWRPPVPET